MISMDVRHPDIEQFVKMKHNLTKVTGANVSVKISDSFMEAVENNETFTLQFPVDADEPDYTAEVEAAALWDTIIESATKTAEPGLLMWDNITKNLPAHEYDDFKTKTTNPCGEIPLSAYDSCRLISLNLKSLVKNSFQKNADFDFSKLQQIAAETSKQIISFYNHHGTHHPHVAWHNTCFVKTLWMQYSKFQELGGEELPTHPQKQIKIAF